MRSLYEFIVRPIGDKYDNTKKVGDKSLILNTSIENFKAVNNYAEVIATPKAFKTDIKEGDTVIIHHNVFRVFYDIRGNVKKSRSNFDDDLFFCGADQIYLYRNSGDWKSFGDRCFVMPLKNKDSFKEGKEQKLIGVLKHGNSSLEALGINTGDIVGFTPNSEWDFVIDNERVYCMKSNDIVIKYENRGNEEEYNPSWAKSS